MRSTTHFILLICAVSFPQRGESFNAIVNANPVTMWMYNYFRANGCFGLSTFCNSLATVANVPENGQGITLNPTDTTNTTTGDGGGDVAAYDGPTVVLYDENGPVPNLPPGTVGVPVATTTTASSSSSQSQSTLASNFVIGDGQIASGIIQDIFGGNFRRRRQRHRRYLRVSN